MGDEITLEQFKKAISVFESNEITDEDLKNPKYKKRIKYYKKMLGKIRQDHIQDEVDSLITRLNKKEDVE